MKPSEILRKQRLEREAEQAKTLRHKETIQSLGKLEQSQVQAITSLVRFLQGHTSKTEVVNQLKEIGTPDAFKVMSAVNDMHSTLKKLKNTDLQPLVSVMTEMLTEVQKIPKENAEAPESVEINNLPDFDAYTQRVEDAIKSIDTKPVVNLPAPQFNVEAPNVQIEAPDFATLEKSIKKVVEAIKNQVFPETKVDTQSIVKEQKKSNELLQKIVEKPTGGGGSGGHTTPYQDSQGKPSYVTLENGGIPVSTNPISNYLIVDEEDTGTYAYTGYENASGSWCIQRETLASGAYRYAAGTSNYSTAWTNRASQTYQYPSQTF